MKNITILRAYEDATKLAYIAVIEQRSALLTTRRRIRQAEKFRQRLVKILETAERQTDALHSIGEKFIETHRGG